MVGHLVKTLPVRFFKYGLVTELFRETCKGGLILSILAAYVPSNLKSFGFNIIYWSTVQTLEYRKTPNKRPWTFAGIIALKKTSSPSNSFLRNENRTIFSRDIAKNVKKTSQLGA